MSLCTAITAGGPCLLPKPCRVHGNDDGWPTNAPLGRTDDAPEDVRGARSQREGSGQAGETADPRPDNRFYREALCTRKGCGRPRSEHDFGEFCP